MKDAETTRAGREAGQSEAPQDDRLRFAALMLATTPAALEALLAGMAVPRTSLREKALLALGEPLYGPDFKLGYESALRLELVGVNGAEDPDSLAEQGGLLQVSPLEAFAAVDEPTADPIIGGEEATILSLGGMMVLYGDGGAGKTTLELDLVAHLGAGQDWLGLPVAKEQKILVIENEGPRGMFRKKTRSKLEAWNGKPIGENIFVLEEPWALFSFGEEAYREQLLGLIQAHQFDIVAAGPVNRLGMEGGGTPDEVGAFILNIELIRSRLERPIAVVFAHHENKAGDVSGAWEGVPDTLAHIQASGNGKTRVFWQKVRWGPQLHGKTWMLNWADGESFEIEEKVERSDFDIGQELMVYVSDHPGTLWKPAREAVKVQLDRLTKIRDELLEQGRLVNQGTPTRMALYLQDSVGSQADLDIPLA